VFVVKLDNIHTKIVKFKQATKAWVIGKVRYCLMKWIDSETKKVVYNALKLATFTGLWTWNKMWLWKISVYFSN
jgi:hypothetical protein